MTPRARLFASLSGIVGNLTHIPLLCVAAGWFVAGMPDLGSADVVKAYYEQHGDLVKTAVLIASLGLPFYLWFSAFVNTKLRTTSDNPLTWLSIGTELAIWIVYIVTLGLIAAAELLHDQLDAQMVLVLHGGATLLAAPLAITGSTYFVVFVALNRQCRAFPGWMNAVAVVAALGNGCSFFGYFAATGPLNASNGMIGVVIPLLAYGLFANALGLVLARDVLRERRAGAATPAPVGAPVVR